MRRIYFLIFMLFTSLVSKSQVELYADTFSTDASKWQFDQEDGLGNVWTINNIYSCSTPTPDNGGIYYMHIMDDLNSEECAMADILGYSSPAIYATMKTGVSTMQQNLVTIKFDWLCSGQVALFPTYGSIDYSINGGTTWTNITTPVSRYSGQSTWTTATITSSQVTGLLNQSDLRLRFGFTLSGYGNNPAFAIDNLSITGDVATAVAPTLRSKANVNVLMSADGEELFVNADPLSGASVITVYNLLGKEMLSLTSKNDGAEKINIHNLTAGIYMVRIDNEAGTTMRKIIKNNPSSINR